MSKVYSSIKVLAIRHLFINRYGYIDRIVSAISKAGSNILIIGGNVIYDTESSDVIFAATINSLIKLSTAGATVVLVLSRDCNPIIQSAINSYSAQLSGESRAHFYNIVAPNQYIILRKYNLGLIIAQSLSPTLLSGANLRIPADLCDVSEGAPAKYNILITLQSRADIPAYLEHNPRGVTIHNNFGGTALKISHIFGFDNALLDLSATHLDLLCQSSKSMSKSSSGNICYIIYPENSQQLGFDEPVNLSVIAATIDCDSRAVTAEPVAIDCFGGYLVATYKSDMLISYNRRGSEYIVNAENYSQIKFIFIDCSADFIARTSAVKDKARSRSNIASKLGSTSITSNLGGLLPPPPIKVIIQKVNSQQIIARRLEISKIAPNFLNVGASNKYSIARLQLINYMIFGDSDIDLQLEENNSRVKVLTANLGAFGRSTLCNSIAGALYGLNAAESINRESAADSAEVSVSIKSRANISITNKISKYRNSVNRSASIDVVDLSPTRDVSNNYFDNAAADIDNLLFSTTNTNRGASNSISKIVLHKETDIRECISDNCGQLRHALITCWYLSSPTPMPTLTVNLISDIYMLPAQEQINIWFELFGIKPDLLADSNNSRLVAVAVEDTNAGLGGVTDSYIHNCASIAELIDHILRELILLDSANLDHYEKLRATMKYCLKTRRDFVVDNKSESQVYSPIDINTRGAKKSAGITPQDISFLTEYAAESIKERLAADIEKNKVYKTVTAAYDEVINNCLECAATLSRCINTDLIEYVRESDRISQYIKVDDFNSYCGDNGLYDLLREYNSISDLNVDKNPKLYSAFMNYVLTIFDSFTAGVEPNSCGDSEAINSLIKYLNILVERRDKICHIIGVVDITSQIQSLLKNLCAIASISNKIKALRLVGGETISCIEFVELVRDINAICKVDIGRNISILFRDILSRFEELFIGHLNKYSSPDYFNSDENLTGDNCDELCNYYYRAYSQLNIGELGRKTRAGSIVSNSTIDKSIKSIKSIKSTKSRISDTSRASKSYKSKQKDINTDSCAQSIDNKTVQYVTNKVGAVVKLLKLIFDGIKGKSITDFINRVAANMSNYRFINITLLVFYNTIIHKANTYREAAESSQCIVDAPRYSRLLGDLDQLKKLYESAHKYKRAKVSARQQEVLFIQDAAARFGELLAYISEIVNNYLVTIEVDKELNITAEIAGTKLVPRYNVSGQDISTYDTETKTIISILLRVVMWQLSVVTLPKFFLIDIEAQLGRISARTLSKLFALISSPRVGAQFVLIVSAPTLSNIYGAEYIHIKKRGTLSETSYIAGATTDIVSTHSNHIEQYFSIISDNPVKYRCIICDKEIKGIYLIRHIKSKGHSESIIRHTQ